MAFALVACVAPVDAAPEDATEPHHVDRHIAYSFVARPCRRGTAHDDASICDLGDPLTFDTMHLATWWCA